MATARPSVMISTNERGQGGGVMISTAARRVDRRTGARKKPRN